MADEAENLESEEQILRYTTAEFNQIVRERLAQAAKEEFGDYEDLKRAAEEASEVEKRIESMEAQLNEARLSILRTEVAVAHGISTRRDPSGAPSDAEFFLTGTNADALNEQAHRFAARIGKPTSFGNVASAEGKAPTPQRPDPMREFVSDFFGKV